MSTIPPSSDPDDAPEPVTDPTTRTPANASVRQFARNFAARYLGIGTTLLLSFVLTAIVLHHLGTRITA